VGLQERSASMRRVREILGEVLFDEQIRDAMVERRSSICSRVPGTRATRR
jgi:hypothetical protein